MSDDLVKRLRLDAKFMSERFGMPVERNAAQEAADHIEELEAKLAQAVEALEYYKDQCERGIRLFPNGKSASTTFAELKGDTDALT
jgi:hypothetical protein